MNMSDVARIAGVSRQTVSAVLNNRPWVSEETRQRILDIIREHNYAPNQHAVTLKGKATNLLGVVLGDLSNPFFTQVALGIESVARSHQYGILYHNTFEYHDYEVAAIRSLVAYRVAGIIISPIIVGADLSHLWQVHTGGTPIVSLDKIPGFTTPAISFADEEGAYAATRYLIECGHRRIAFLGGPTSSASARARLMGFRSCMVDHGVPIAPRLVAGAGTSEDDRAAAARALLMEPAERPTAILCFNDRVALTVYKIAHELQIRIPEDLSVMGFDDIELASVLGPPLTTMRLDAYGAGAEAASLVLAQIRGEASEARKDVRFPAQLVKRQSVAVLAEAAMNFSAARTFLA